MTISKSDRNETSLDATSLMDSPKASSYEATATTKPFAPLLVEDRPSTGKTKHVTRQLTDFSQTLWSKRAWKEALFAAVTDLIELNWIATITWLFVLAWLAGLGVLLSYIVMQPAIMTGSKSSACQPDGSFSIFADRYDFWAASGFFQITMAWGTLTFANAKFVDVAWDVIVGRGGQALLAWVSWNIFSDYVTTSIEMSPVTYNTFWAIYLQEQPTLYSTWYLIRDFSRSHRLQSRVAMVFMVVVAIFVLLFPTFSGAMTGYLANNKAFVSGYDGEMLKFSDFDMITYVIHDGWRVNLDGDYPIVFRRTASTVDQMIGEIMGNYVPSTWYNSYNPMSCVTEPSYRDEGIRKNWEERNPLNTRCFMHANVSNYVKEYGFFGLEDKTSIWMNQTLPAPTLNISAFYIPEPYDEVLYGRNWTDPRTNSMPFLDKKRLAYSYSPGNQTYSLNHIETYGSCQPVSEIAAGNDSVRETYQWGFSYIQLFVMTILLVLWTIGVSAMWLKAHMTMRMRGGCDKPMGFKGVLELAAAIQKQLQETNPNDLSHDQLSEEIKKRLRGGSIQLEREEATAMYGLWKGLWGWVIERKWWFTTLLVFAGFATLIYISRSISWFFIPTAAVLIAVVVGQSGKSRAMLTLAGVILGTIVFVAVESALYQRERY